MATALYISDVHGEYDMFAHILQTHRHVDRVHLIGDIYDRGPAPHKIMDLLIDTPNIDVQWGNHDIVWMGASLGQRGCIAHVVRNCARYGNLDILTGPYGMDIKPLVDFALKAYADDPCDAFGLKGNPGLSPQELETNIKIQKAMAVLQFKVEGKIIDDNPGFGLEDRKLLDKIDYEHATVPVDGVVYEMTDTYFPTVDRDDPYALTSEEEQVMQALEHAFTSCTILQEHIRFLLEAGSLYKIAEGNLLLHACVPLDDDGSLKEVDVFGTTCKGKTLYDTMQEWVYKAFRSNSETERRCGRDMIWYLWLGQGSPLFAKSKMATFEIYLCKDKAARKEIKNPFYSMFEQSAPYENIFRDFCLDPDTSRIICGHVPVKVKDGEDPVKAGGRVICIDGGMSAAYQKTTGIAGYALENDGQNLMLLSLDTDRNATSRLIAAR
jgi:fructose-1,6-bisphosphatase-3